MSTDGDDMKPRVKDPFAIAVLLVICFALLIYRLALAWTPIWLDLFIGFFVGLFFLFAKLDSKAKRSKDANEKHNSL